jgi:hypothetical protein
MFPSVSSHTSPPFSYGRELCPAVITGLPSLFMQQPLLSCFVSLFGPGLSFLRGAEENAEMQH